MARKLSRKDFMKRTVAASAALPFMAALPRTSIKAPSFPKKERSTSDEAFWEEVRQQYLLDESVVNLNNGSVGPQPICVQEVHMEMYRQSNRAPAYHMWKKLNKQREELRASLAALMGADPEEVAINRNTTEGLSTVIFGMNLQAGDEVVVSDFDYPFMLNAWRQRQARDGILLKQVQLALPIEDVEQAGELYRSAITPRTKVVHLTHVINWTGQVMPVKEITAMAKEHGCEVVVDSAHALAHIPCSFREIGCDYMATSLHKWLGAPFGTGALVIRKEKKEKLWPLMAPYEPLSDAIDKFEFLGTRSIPAEMAVLRAIEFHTALGPQNVYQRLHQLKNHWAEQVMGLERLILHTSLKPEFSGAIATVSIHGLTASDMATHLWNKGHFDVGHVVWNGMDAVRISPHIYTSLQELDQLADAIHEIAS